MSPTMDTSKVNGSTNVVSCQDKVFNKISAITGFSYVSCILTIYMLIYDEVPQPYMDENFHVKQVQSYCVHNFTQWNPKLTTPPGLYLTTWVLFKPIMELIAFGEDDSTRKCPLPMVRSINLLFAIANVYLLYSIGIKNHRYASRINKVKSLISAISLSTFPPLFFFNFLYYTDAGSLFLILMMYLFHLNGRFNFASLFGFLSLFYRQTNIVWCCFLASYSALKIFQTNLERSKRRARLFTVAISSIPTILSTLGGYVLVGLLFIIFVIYNEGIVLGDRSAHQATVHEAQIVYFLYFTSFFAFSWIFTLSNMKKFIVFCYKNVIFSATLLVMLILSIKYQNSAHPYLLADNRHYTFYLWRRFFGKKDSILRYGLLTMCQMTLWSLFYLVQRRDNLWKCLFFIFTCISIAPQQLVEFRYFIPSFILWRLNISISSSLSLALELILNIFVNALTIYIFLIHPFKWPNSPELQRFMW